MTQSGRAQSPLGPASSKPELTVRVITAVVLAPVVLVAAWAGGIWFALLVAIGVGLAGYEWSRLIGTSGPVLVTLLVSVGLVAAIALLAIGSAALLLALVALAAAASIASTTNRVWPLIGVVYLGLPAAAILTLRADSQAGLEALFFLFGVVWLTDIGAYFCGRAIGGPRLAPAISPGKTWAGAIGGLALAVVAAYFAADFMETPLPFGAVLLAICLSVATQCGDLFESWVKRRFDKKDSGTIIPGHGGILDRIDGLLFAAPVMAAITFAQRGTVPLWP